MVTKYPKWISGPLLDRIDIHIEVPRLDYEKLSGDRLGESSAVIRERVRVAQDVQRQGFLKLNSEQPLACTTDLPVREIWQFCQLQNEGHCLMGAARSQLNSLACASYRTRSMKLAWTTADVAGREETQSTHSAEALQYRPKLKPSAMC